MLLPRHDTLQKQWQATSDEWQEKGKSEGGKADKARFFAAAQNDSERAPWKIVPHVPAGAGVSVEAVERAKN